MNILDRTAVIYARSATGEAGSPVLQAQLAECRAACATAGLRVVTELVDAEASGLCRKRSGRRALLDVVASKAVDAVVMTSLDRYSRDMADFAELASLCAQNENKLIMEGGAWDGEASARDAACLAATFKNLRRAARRARQK